MSRVYLEKAGFIRSAEEDFGDDGTKFYCYRTPSGRVRLSKATSSGYIYLSGRIDGNLQYDEYSKLPHYKCMDAFNGVDQGIITQQDVVNLFNDCLEYEKEYIEAESKIVWPTKEEIAAKHKAITEKRAEELKNVTEMCTVSMLLDLDEYKLRWFKSAFNSLKTQAEPNCSAETFAEKNYKTRFSREYVTYKDDLKDSYWYECCVKYLTEK